MREIITTSILLEFDQKNHFLGLVLALGIGTGTRYKLKFLHQCAKWAKTKSQKVLRANSYVCRSYKGKTGSWIKAVRTGGARGALAPLAIFFSKVKVPFFNNHFNIFYLAWHKVKSCFRCIPSKIMIKFACSVMSVIIYHDISWCMYVNSLVVVWSPIEQFYGSS